VKPAVGFLAFVEGQALYRDGVAGGARKPFAAGVAGLTVGTDKKRLFYSPLASRHLYSVALDVLTNESSTDVDLSASVVDHGEKGATDSLEVDDDDRISSATTNQAQSNVAGWTTACSKQSFPIRDFCGRRRSPFRVAGTCTSSPTSSIDCPSFTGGGRSTRKAVHSLSRQD
jgi:hypothetical protein